MDGIAHRISRDEGGVVRAPAPALVVATPLDVGAEVQAGAPVLVLESMKMETVLRAPFRARLRECLVAVGGLVETWSAACRAAGGGLRARRVGARRGGERRPEAGPGPRRPPAAQPRGAVPRGRRDGGQRLAGGGPRGAGRRHGAPDHQARGRAERPPDPRADRGTGRREGWPGGGTAGRDHPRPRAGHDRPHRPAAAVPRTVGVPPLRHHNEDLRELVAEGPLPASEALRIMAAVAPATLAVAHRGGVTHGHLVPANIVLAPDNVKLTDFGLAPLNRPRATAASAGSPLLHRSGAGLAPPATCTPWAWCSPPA